MTCYVLLVLCTRDVLCMRGVLCNPDSFQDPLCHAGAVAAARVGLSGGVRATRHPWSRGLEPDPETVVVGCVFEAAGGLSTGAHPRVLCR